MIYLTFLTAKYSGLWTLGMCILGDVARQCVEVQEESIRISIFISIFQFFFVYVFSANNA